MATSDPSNPEIDKYGEKQVASEGEKQDTKDNVIETKVEPDHGEQDTNQNAAAIQSKTDVEMQEADAVKENLEEQLEVTDVKAPDTQEIQDDVKATETDDGEKRETDMELEISTEVVYERISVNQVEFFKTNESPVSFSVKFIPEKGVELDGQLISLDHLRYASQRSYRALSQEAYDCIVLSYCGGSIRDVRHYFLKKETAQETKQLSEDFSKLLKEKFYDTETEGTLNESCYTTVNEQPIYFGVADVKVKSFNDKIIVHEGRSLMVLDIECFTIYPEVEGNLGEPYRFMFWKEEGDNTVERILHYSKDNKVGLETPALILEMPVIDGIVNKLNDLRPKDKNLLAEKALLRQWVPRAMGIPTAGSASFDPVEPSSVSGEMLCLPRPGEIQQRHEAAILRRLHDLTDTEASSSATGWTEGVQRQQRELDVSLVREFNRELDNAVEQFENTEDFQYMWISIEADLSELIESGKVPETDPYSGGLDPDNVDHFIKALSDVVDQLKEQKLNIAVSRIQAARKIFQASRNLEIGGFFRLSDIELLKKLYFKSLVQ